MTTNATAPRAPTFWEAFAYWLKLGFISFGGPAGQIAIMHADLVERKRWISEKRYLHALNYCMVLPGPEAQQLATYIGWLMHRTWGGIVAGGLFVLPSLFMLMGLSWTYMAYGDVPAIADGCRKCEFVRRCGLRDAPVLLARLLSEYVTEERGPACRDPESRVADGTSRGRHVFVRTAADSSPSGRAR